MVAHHVRLGPWAMFAEANINPKAPRELAEAKWDGLKFPTDHLGLAENRQCDHGDRSCAIDEDPGGKL